MLIILFSILAISCSAAPTTICPSLTDNYITDLCYKIVNIPKTFEDARQSCHSQGYSLAVLHSGIQGNFLASLVNSVTGTNDNTFWIGLQRSTPSSKFYWDDGSSMYWTYWSAGFPNGNNQAAVSTINGRWRTLDAFEKHVYVCSYDPKTPVPTTLEPIIPSSSTQFVYTTIPFTDSTTAQPATDYITPSTDFHTVTQDQTDYYVTSSTPDYYTTTTPYPTTSA